MRRAAELLVEEDDQQPQSSITDPGSIQPRTVAERRAQGLGPHVTDPDTLLQVAALLASAMRQQGGGRDAP